MNHVGGEIKETVYLVSLFLIYYDEIALQYSYHICIYIKPIFLDRTECSGQY